MDLEKFVKNRKMKIGRIGRPKKGGVNATP